MMSREILQEKYKAGMSMQEMAAEFKVNPRKVDYWMKKFDIQKRNRSEALYKKYNKMGDPFCFKDSFDVDDSFLFGLGFGLFWGRGDEAK